MHAAQLYQQARDAAEAIRSTADVASFAFADVSGPVIVVPRERNSGQDMFEGIID